jgi:hypothetical protein
MEEMESFFAFLKEHIENKGYSNMRKKYMLTPLEEELYGPDENGLYSREPESYFQPDLVSTLLENSDELLTTDEEFTDYPFINPKKQYILTKTFNDKKELINESTIYLYDDLIKLYGVEMKKIKNYYGQFLMNPNPTINRNQFEEGLLIRLNYYIELVDKQWFVVYDKNDRAINLLLDYLRKIIDWLENNSAKILNNEKETPNKSNNTKKYDSTKPLLNGTKLNHQNYVAFYNAEYMKSNSISDAKKSTINHFRISEKTLDRALLGSK